MKYILRKNVIMTVPEVEITADEYVRLAASRETLNAALAIEEKYELLVRSYLSFEEDFLKATTGSVVRSDHGYLHFFEMRTTLNASIINLLSCARLYLDQLPQDLPKCAPGSLEIVTKWRAQCSKEYDENFEYRFMEVLRNHVQHQGLAVHSTSLHSGWTDDPARRMEYRLNAFARRKILETNQKFKKDTLAEMQEDVDLKAAARRYVESLSTIHQVARDLIKPDTTAARKTIQDAHERYKRAGSDDVLGLTAFAFAEDDETEDTEIPLLLEWDDIRLDLQRRNEQLFNLSKRYATGA